MSKLRSLAVATLAAAVLVPTTAQAAPKNSKQNSKQQNSKQQNSKGGKQQNCKKSKGKGCQPKSSAGRMTGHGHQFNASGFDKVQWEFRNSVCNANRFPDLKVEFGGNRFILTSYNDPGLQCVDTVLDEGNPRAGFDTITASGAGTLNGAPATITFAFGDAGEPGRNDTARFTIMDADGNVAIDYTGGAIDGGNHQAHRR